MAEKRMFTKKITDTDVFQEMPLSTQALYFHLNMNADDDGFVRNPRRIARLIGASDDDLKLLIVKRFVLTFDTSGVIVIKHWRMHNTLRMDRYHPTEYQEELRMLGLKSNNSYTDRLDCPEITSFPGRAKGALPEQLPEPDGDDSGNHTATEWQPDGTRGLGLGKDLDLGKGLDIGSDIEEDVCTAPRSEPVLTIFLNDGSEYPIMQDYIDEMQALYPAVDVLQELKKMKAWSINNPKKRKTKSGIKRFIGSWLAKEQDRGGREGTTGRYGNGTGAAKRGRYDLNPGEDAENDPRWANVHYDISE